MRPSKSSLCLIGSHTQERRLLPGFRAGVSALALALMAEVPSAFAEPSEENEFADLSLEELTEVEVFNSASMLPTEQNKAPGTVYSFGRDDFTRLGVRRIDDLMAYVPGFQMSQNRKRHRTIWARGLVDTFNDKLVLMVDGIRRQHVYYGNFSLGDEFPLERIEKVEIILGPASTLYGANAFGGIISITTRQFAKKSQVVATGEGADNNRGKGTLLYNSEKIQAFGSYLSQDAPFREDRKSFVGGETLQPLDENYGNLFFKATPIDGLTLAADYSRVNTPYLFIPKDQDSFVDSDTLTLYALYEKGDLDKGKLQANFFYTWDMRKEYERERATPLYHVVNTEHQGAAMAGSTITGFKRLFDDHVATLGFNWLRTEATNMDFMLNYDGRSHDFIDPPVTGSLLADPNVSNDDFAVFVQDVWTLSRQLDLTVGGRFDHFEMFGSHLNYRAALVYAPDERQTVKLMYGTATRTPTFREYLKVLEGTDFVPPIPDPERLETAELGYGLQWKRGSLNLTAFHNEVNDYILEVSTPDNADEYFANGPAHWHMYGVETLLQFKLLDNLDLRLSGTYLNSKNVQTGPVPYLSAWTGNFSLNYEFVDAHRLGFAVDYQSNRADTNTFSQDDPGDFIVANLFGSGRLTHQLSYAYGVDNVFDSRIYDPAPGSGNRFNSERSGREIWGRLTWSFEP